MGNIVDISSSSCSAGGNKRGLSKENNNEISGHNDKRRKSVLCKEKRKYKKSNADKHVDEATQLETDMGEYFDICPPVTIRHGSQLGSGVQPAQDSDDGRDESVPVVGGGGW